MNLIPEAPNFYTNAWMYLKEPKRKWSTYLSGNAYSFRTGNYQYSSL